jgi:hypothetical protein
MNDTTPGTQIPFGDLPKAQMDEKLAQCNSKACRDATTELQNVRNEVLLACDAVKRATASRNEYMALMVAFYTLAIASFAAAGAASGTIPLIGLAIGAVLAAIGMVFLTIALIFTLLLVIQQRVVDDTTATAVAVKTKFLASVNSVMHSCNEYCLPNLELPACPT